MKKFILFLLLLVLLAAGAAAYLMYCRPETPAGAWVKAQYDRFFPAADTAGAADAADVADAEPDAPAEPDGEAVPEASPETKPPLAEKKVVRAEKPDIPEPPEAAVSGEEPPAAPVPKPKPKPFSKANWYAGKKLTADDVRGRTVLVCLFDVADARSVAMLGRVQKTWESFRHKPFTVIGSHRGARSKKVLKALQTQKVTFPVYQDAYLPCEPAPIDETSYFYVVKPNGRLGYHGVSDLEATEAVVNILSDSIGQ